MKHTKALTIGLLALGCQPHQPQEDSGEGKTAGTLEPKPSDGPSVAPPLPAPVPAKAPAPPEPRASAPAGPVAFRQLQIDRPSSWRFAPDGTKVAAKVQGLCGLWQLDNGDYLGPAGTGEASPCLSWAPLQPVAWSRGNLSLPHPDGVRTLVTTHDRFELGTLSGQAGEGSYRAAAFSPDGDRLALFVGADANDDEQGVEIWQLGAGKLERTLEFDGNIGERRRYGTWLAERAYLRWTERSLVAALDVESVCDASARPDCVPDHVVRVQIWPSLDAEATERQLPDPDQEFGETVEQLQIDPEAHSLFATIAGVIPDDGRTGHELQGLSLRDGAAHELISPMWTDGETEPDDVPPTMNTRPWTDAVGSSAWALSQRDCCYWDEIGWYWSLTSVRGLPDRSVELAHASGFVHQQQAGGDGRTFEVELAARDRLLLEHTVCWDADLHADDSGCKPEPTLPKGCALVDASWDVSDLLLVCDERWLLVTTPALGKPIELAGGRELARGSGEPRAVVLGPKGLAIWTAAEGLRMVRAEQVVATHPEVTALHRARLDEELDLALVRVGEGLRVANLELAALGPTLAWTGKVEHAAFAPDRERVAIAGEGTLAVFAFAEGRPIGTWQWDTKGIAFRQDGEVLYIGRERALPELALDPATGIMNADATLAPALLERIAAASLDPSWRWALEGDDTLLRTLDGQALFVINQDTALAEHGWFVGDAKWFSQFRVRIGGDPAAPVYALTALEQLRRPTLIDEFVSGKPLASPSITPPPN